MKKGFTLLEVMLVLAVLAIISAIAIPNLIRNRLKANEANAIAALKTYATAQVTFQTGKQGRTTRNTLAGMTGFCDNFRNLHYGNPIAEVVGRSIAVDTGRNLALVNQAFADAFAGPKLAGAAEVNSGAPKTAATTATAFSGYLFIEPSVLGVPPVPPGGAATTQFTNTFALHAVPSRSSATGDSTFWVGMDSIVWQAGLSPDQDAAISITLPTPSTPGCVGWQSL